MKDLKTSQNLPKRNWFMRLFNLIGAFQEEVEVPKRVEVFGGYEKQPNGNFIRKFEDPRRYDTSISFCREMNETDEKQIVTIFLTNKFTKEDFFEKNIAYCQVESSSPEIEEYSFVRIKEHSAFYTLLVGNRDFAKMIIDKKNSTISMIRFDDIVGMGNKEYLLKGIEIHG